MKVTNVLSQWKSFSDSGNFVVTSVASSRPAEVRNVSLPDSMIKQWTYCTDSLDLSTSKKKIWTHPLRGPSVSASSPGPFPGCITLDPVTFGTTPDLKVWLHTDCQRVEHDAALDDDRQPKSLKVVIYMYIYTCVYTVYTRLDMMIRMREEIKQHRQRK